MRESAARILVVYAQYTDRLSYFDDWLDAFSNYRGFKIDEFNIAKAHGESALRTKLANCDAVVLLHSTNGDTQVYLDRYAAIFGDRRVPLLSFVGNEVNLPGSPISEKRRTLSVIRPDWIATQLLQEAGEFLFGDIVQKGVVSMPHALNPDVFRVTRQPQSRPIDIGARMSRYLAHLGDNDRNRIADTFRDIGPKAGLKIDISSTRFDRDGWAGFLNECKGTISSESGGWFLERDDATVNAIRAYVLKRAGGLVIANDSPLRTLGHRLPSWLKSAMRGLLGAGPVRHETLINEQVPYEEIYAKFFAELARPAFYGKCISSRHFDAIGTKTCQVMIRGRYNDILVADEHYIAIDEDFSNLPEVLDRFKDVACRTRITESAHAHVLARHTYEHRMARLAEILAR